MGSFGGLSKLTVGWEKQHRIQNQMGLPSNPSSAPGLDRFAHEPSQGSTCDCCEDVKIRIASDAITGTPSAEPLLSVLALVALRRNAE